MTITQLGFGGAATGGTYTDLSSLIAEFAPSKYQNAMNLEAPILATGALKRKDAKGREIVGTVAGGAIHSTTFIRDYGRLPVPGNYIPAKWRAQPSWVVSYIRMGHGAILANLADEELTNDLDVAMNESAEATARQVARGIFGGSATPNATGTWSGTAANSTVTLDFVDISLFRPGMAVNFTDTSLSLSYTVRVVSFTPKAVGSNSDNVAGEVTFINDVPNPATDTVVALGSTAVAVDDVFSLRGTVEGFGGASTILGEQLLTSYDDISGSTSGTDPLQGLDPQNVPGWFGRYKNHNAAYSQEAVRGFLQSVKTISGKYPTHIFMNPILAAAHSYSGGVHGAVAGVSAFTVTASTPHALDASVDKYGALNKKMKASGCEIIEDANCPVSRLIAHNKDHCYLAVWQQMLPLKEAGDSLMINRQFFAGEFQVAGGMQLVTDRRNAIGIMDNFTSIG